MNHDIFEIKKLSKSEEIISNLSKSKIGKVFNLIMEGTPYVNIVYSGIVGGIEKKKLLLFLDAWMNKKIDDRFDENDHQQIELMNHGILKSLRCNKDGQIQQIVNILNWKYQDEIESFNDAEDLINIVSELSGNEARVLERIYAIFKGKIAVEEEKKARKPRGQITVTKRGTIYVSQAEIESEISAFKERLDFFLGRLEGKGLIKEKSLDTFDDLDNEAKKYIVTFTGNMLFQSLNNEKLFRE